MRPVRLARRLGPNPANHTRRVSSATGPSAQSRRATCSSQTRCRASGPQTVPGVSPDPRYPSARGPGARHLEIEPHALRRTLHASDCLRQNSPRTAPQSLSPEECGAYESSSSLTAPGRLVPQRKQDLAHLDRGRLQDHPPGLGVSVVPPLWTPMAPTHTPSARNVRSHRASRSRSSRDPYPIVRMALPSTRTRVPWFIQASGAV